MKVQRTVMSVVVLAVAVTAVQGRMTDVASQSNGGAASRSLLLRSPFGLPSQHQRERSPCRRFHLIRGWKLSSTWGQAKQETKE